MILIMNCQCSSHLIAELGCYTIQHSSGTNTHAELRHQAKPSSAEQAPAARRQAGRAPPDPWGIVLGSQLAWEKTNTGFQSTTSRFPPWKAVTLQWSVPLLTGSCCCLDISWRKRKMLESQAVKGLEETCQTLVFKSLLGKGLTELNTVAGSVRLSTQRDWLPTVNCH